MQQAAEALERTKHALLVAMMKGAMPRMTRMEEEQEFLAAVADGIIAVYAVDSAIARAHQAVSAQARTSNLHVLCARLATARLLSQARNAIETILLATFSGDELQAELSTLHSYAPGYLVNSVALGQELAAVVLAQNGYPFSLVRA